MIQGNQQTLTIDEWPYYEFEDYIRLLNKRNEDEKKAREEGEQGNSYNSEYKKMSKIANSFKPSNFKMPNMKMPH